MKSLQGLVVSTNMQNTAVVEVVRKQPHPLYKKLIRRSKKYKADTKGVTVSIGDWVKIVETRPVSKDKHFKISQVTKKESK